MWLHPSSWQTLERRSSLSNPQLSGYTWIIADEGSGVVVDPESPEAAVPEADLQEQLIPEDGADPRRHAHDPELPEADVLEQELPVDGGVEPITPDEDRVEPIDDSGYSYGD